MCVYRAYGLGVHSVLPLPELIPLAGAGADVVVSVGRIPTPFSWNSDEQCATRFTAAEAYLFWPLVGAFLVRGGKEIVIDSRPGAEHDLVRLPLLGAVWAVLLHQRGLLVLHASAVEIHGRAAVFIGSKGAGKSTIAALLYSRGHSLIADDIVAVDFSNPRQPMLLPGFPQLKLWPEAAIASLGDDPEQLRILIAGQSKRARPISERFSPVPVALAGIFCLSEGDVPMVTRLRPQQAIVQLLANSYMARFPDVLVDQAEAKRHLQQCSTLVEQHPIFQLQRSRRLTSLSETAMAVEDQLTRKMLA